MTGKEVELKLLHERNRLLQESVDLQREHLEFSRQQAVEQQKRLGSYVDDLMIEGLKEVVAELRVAEQQSVPSDDQIIIEHVRNAIDMLGKLMKAKG